MTRLPEQAFDPFATFVQLREGGGATALTWTPDFWRRLEMRDGDRVGGAKRALEPADFHADESEMHPEGDELLYLLTGEVDVLLEEGDSERSCVRSRLRRARRARPQRVRDARALSECGTRARCS